MGLRFGDGDRWRIRVQRARGACRGHRRGVVVWMGVRRRVEIARWHDGTVLGSRTVTVSGISCHTYTMQVTEPSAASLRPATKGR
jgi:hypothetical protein